MTKDIFADVGEVKEFEMARSQGTQSTHISLKTEEGGRRVGQRDAL